MKTKNALPPLLFSLIIQSSPANSETRSNDALSTIFSFPKVVSPILNGNVRTPELEFAFAALVDNLEALPSQSIEIGQMKVCRDDFINQFGTMGSYTSTLLFDFMRACLAGLEFKRLQSVQTLTVRMPASFARGSAFQLGHLMLDVFLILFALVLVVGWRRSLHPARHRH